MDVWSLLQEWKQDLPSTQKETMRSRLSQYLNDLLLHDFSALVQLLYRVDVPEARVKAVLRQNPGVDAGELLADLLIQRQQEKKAAFETYKHPPPDAAEERW